MSELSAMLRKVRGVMVRKGVRNQDVDDLVQEAFLRVESYARKHDVRSREAVMVTAAVNLSRDRARRGARGPDYDHDFDVGVLVDAAPQPDEALAARERLRRLSSGIARLDAKTRRCLLAKRLEGLTAAQVAEREQLSVAAVEKRVARAIVFLTQWTGEI